MLSDSPLSDMYKGLAETMNSPLTAGALPHTVSVNISYFKINWKTSLSVLLLRCVAVQLFSSATMFFPGLIVSINMFSVLWGVDECRTTTAARPKAVIFFLKGKGSLCQIACAVTFSLAADVQIKSFPDVTTEDDCIRRKLYSQDTASPVHLCFPRTGPSFDWSVNVGGSLSPRGRGGGGSLGH